MSTKNESILHKNVTIPEMDISLSLLFDLLNFARDQQNNVERDVDLLKAALKSQYIDRQPFKIKEGLKSATNEALFEKYQWRNLVTCLSNISYEAVNK